MSACGSYGDMMRRAERHDVLDIDRKTTEQSKILLAAICKHTPQEPDVINGIQDALQELERGQQIDTHRILKEVLS